MHIEMVGAELFYKAVHKVKQRESKLRENAKEQRV
jgi:hypothetical protein